ncbi:hypothetical protein KQX63_14355 [Rhodopseudomonas palustris]|uniref:hypothetical protein n=1 Tax=Rhodopseudomonas palustris TaxID=1076 RepID=UPI0021F39F3D|nr:hypothetical protein [Rhodopseudomonas palustris]UYO42588.1 hypothetical protein KQX63_14355 [Rhodopseudomonas palustris]
MAKQEIIPATTSAKMVLASGVDDLLSQIRPAWQAKSLIRRVKDLLPVDPSSACQRLLNAAIHDLREKIIIAGLDVAQEAAPLNGLPQIKKAEDVLEYSTTHTLDLSYHMGLISRPEWRRLKRAYDIRKDLEHEDDQYEAGVEDCVYVFRTCIEIVLAADPIAPVRVSDIKDIVETPKNTTLSNDLIADFGSAPVKRQVEIFKFLISVSGDNRKPDIVRQNAVEALRSLSTSIKKSAGAAVGQHMQEQLRGKPVDLTIMKVAGAAGITAYLKQGKVRQFFEDFHRDLLRIGHRWTSHDEHRRIFDELEDVGGLEVVPPATRRLIVLWMVRCYIGEPGGYGMGTGRPVFYSNVAAPRISRCFGNSKALISADVEAAAKDKFVKAAISDKHIARRLESLRDLIST